jgi:DNA-binding transcriptional LysR family regulator
MNVTLKQIRAFLEISRLHSFTRASEHLNSTQSSLSVLIQELEAELRTRLLDRTTRKVELTDAGREFAPFAERMLLELENGVKATRELVARQRGRLNIASSPLAAAALLPKVIAHFRKLYPGISVAMEEVPPELLSSRIASGLFDCGVGVFDTMDDGLVSIPVFSERLMLACPRHHPLAASLEVEWRQLADHAFIAVTPDNAARRRIDRHFASAGVTIQPAFEVKNMITTLGMVAAGVGIATWPSWAATLTLPYDVVLRPLVRPEAFHTVSIVTSKGRAPSAAVEAFIELLKEDGRSLPDGSHVT